jgi:hypothetical protein
MKRTTEKARHLAVAFAALVAVSCFPGMAMAAHVELAVDSTTAPPRLYVILNDSKCPGGADDCIEVARGSSHNLFFDLDNSCKASGPEYKLQQFRIAMSSKNWPTSGNPLPAHVVDDFDADPNTGYVNLAGGDNQLKDERIKLRDMNSSAYEVFYEITAVSCTGNGEIKLDPTIRNTGK